MSGWVFAWCRARAAEYWNSPAYEDHIFAPRTVSTSHPLTIGARGLDPLEVSGASGTVTRRDPAAVIAERKPGRYMTPCPAHEDDSDSLRVTVLEDGKVLLYCFAGCETLRVLDSLWLDWADLWP